MSDASSGGGYGRPPKPRTVNKKPPKRRDVPAAIPGVGVVAHPPKPSPPPATWTHPVAPVRIAPPRRKTPVERLRPSRAQVQAEQHAQAIRGRQKALEQKVSRAREQVRHQMGTFIGPERPRVELPDSIFAPSPSPILRDSGVANNYTPSYRGMAISPQQTAAMVARLFRPGMPGKQNVLEYLHTAGALDARGTTTHREQTAISRVAERARRKALLEQAWQLQSIQNHNDANIAVSPRELRMQLAGVSNDRLEELIAEASQPEKLSRMGFDPTSVGGLIQGTASGIGDLTRAVTGRGLVGNAVNDVLMWPTWAVPAAYSAATNPGEFVKGLSQGVIGHALSGDFAGAGRAFKEHPVFGLAELRGGASLAGRPITGAVRYGTKGRVFGTARDPVNLTGLDMSSAYRDRSFSRDPVTMAGQKIADRVLTRRGLDVRVPGKGRQPARTLKTTLPVIGPALEASRVHGLQRMTDYNRAQGVTAQQTLRDAAIETVKLSKIDSPLGRKIAKFLDLPQRPTSSGAYEGILGRLAANAAETVGVGKLATNPSAMVVSLVLRGLIRSEVVHENGHRTGPTMQSVAHDLDMRIRELNEELATPGNYRTVPDWEQAAAHVEFLEQVRDSGRGLAHVVGVARRLAPEFKKNDRELIRLRALDPAAAERAPLFPAAMSQGVGEFSTVPYDRLVEQQRAAKKNIRAEQAKLGRLSREEQRHLGRTHDVLTPQASRAIRAADEEFATAAKARSQASRELTAANKHYRNTHNGAPALYTDAQRLAAVARREAARQAVTQTKASYEQALASFEDRVSAVVAKAQRGERLTAAERQLIRYDRVPARRLAALENVRGQKEGARASLAAQKREASALAARLAAAKRGTLHGPDGAALPNEQIRDALIAHGIDPELIAHLPHQPLGRGAFYKQTGESRRNADTHSLTGAMHKRGESAFDWDHVTASLVHGRTLAANIRTLDQFVHDLGVRVGDGSWKETERIAANEIERNKDGTPKLDGQGQPIPKYVVLRRMGSRLDADRREGIGALQDVQTDRPLSESMLDDRLQPPPKDGPDVAVLVPRQAVERARESLKGGGATINSFQALSGQFRQTVLPFSTKWLFGNVAEAILRTTLTSVNPLERRTARLALDRMLAEDALATYGHDPAVRDAATRMMDIQRTLHPREVRALRQALIDYAPNAHAAEMELIGGLFFGAKGQTVRRTGEEMGRVGAAVAAATRLPFIHEYFSMTRWLGRKIFALNRVMEREAQYAALGKHVRNELQNFSGRWQSGIRLNEAAMRDFTRGMRGTPAQLKAANWLDETLGRYSRFSPTTRKWIQTYMPFLPWYLNAVRFTMLTVPFKHPIKFALWTSAERTFEQDWQDQHKDIPPNGYGDFRAAIPTKDGGFKLGVTQSTPFGLLGPIGGRGNLGDFASLVLPQFSGVQSTLLGKTPFGEDLALPEGMSLGPLDYAKLAGYNFLEAMLPGLNLTRRLREQAGTGLATSTAWSPQIKPGSAGNKGRGESALNKVFNAPFRTTYLRAGTEGSSTADMPEGLRRIVERARAKAAAQAARPGGVSPGVQAIIERARAAAGG